eukprot:scaffold80693_cov33-Phaeocystis_antarctica.AAC.1
MPRQLPDELRAARVSPRPPLPLFITIIDITVPPSHIRTYQHCVSVTVSNLFTAGFGEAVGHGKFHNGAQGEKRAAYIAPADSFGDRKVRIRAT